MAVAASLWPSTSLSSRSSQKIACYGWRTCTHANLVQVVGQSRKEESATKRSRQNLRQWSKKQSVEQQPHNCLRTRDLSQTKFCSLIIIAYHKLNFAHSSVLNQEQTKQVSKKFVQEKRTQRTHTHKS